MNNGPTRNDPWPRNSKISTEGTKWTGRECHPSCPIEDDCPFIAELTQLRAYKRAQEELEKLRDAQKTLHGWKDAQDAIKMAQETIEMLKEVNYNLDKFINAIQ